MIIIIPQEFLGLSATGPLQIQELAKPTDLVEVLSKVDFTKTNVYVTVKDTRMFDILQPYESVLRWVNKVEGAVPVQLPFDESLIIDIQNVLDVNYVERKGSKSEEDEDELIGADTNDPSESSSNG